MGQGNSELCRSGQHRERSAVQVQEPYSSNTSMQYRHEEAKVRCGGGTHIFELSAVGFQKEKPLGHSKLNAV